VSKVLVVLESGGASLTRASFEALTAAHMLGAHVTAVVLGADTAAPATAAAFCKVERVVRLEHSLLATYSADGWIAALEPLIRTEAPSFVLFPHSYQTRDFAPALAVRFGQMLVSDVVTIAEGPVFTRPVQDGRLMARCRMTGAEPGFISVQAGAFAAAVPGDVAAPITALVPELAASAIRTTASQPFRAKSVEVDLASATRIVSVGRGIQGQENLPLIEALVQALHAELAASRPVCDAGWVSADRQVGSSGQTVAPRLYLAVGISGATQHLQGMRGASCIVAINRDASAPIFEVADYGIVGDLFEVVPAITQALRSA